jgi:hypothetical protein
MNAETGPVVPGFDQVPQNVCEMRSEGAGGAM